MYDFFDGTIAARTATRVTLAVSGIGYDFAIPVLSDFRRAHGPAGESDEEFVRVWAHLVVREDAQLLFGFATRETRELFRLLLSVRGVGPGLALAVLSGLTREELVDTIAAGDVKGLTRIKGVGKKTAEQMLLDLKDKLSQLIAPGVLLPHQPSEPRQGNKLEDAISALVSIGYAEKEARKNVERAAKKVGDAEVEELVRHALLG